ncbi:MAG: peptidase, partial [Clostridia bacterium]|nr:peptidase [Clostridia bacterium]
ARAEGEAQAIYLAKKAEADGLRALMEAGIDGTVLELKKYEALINVANGKAAKLIIPSDVVDTVKKNVIFSETAGLGDQTESAPEEPAKKKKDPCCD